MFRHTAFRSFLGLTVASLLLAGSFSHSKPPNITPADVPVLGEVDPYLIKAIYQSTDPDASLADVQDDPEYRALIEKYNLQRLGGPMLGNVTPNSAQVWLRTTKPAAVKVIVSSQPSLADPVASAESETDARNDFTTVLSLSGLQPWTEYYYDVLVDGKRTMGKALPKFRTNPRPGQATSFSVGFGGGARYWSDKERIWDTIAKERPHAFLFLGDNLYIDEPDWRGKQRAMYYRRQLRPEFQRLTSSAATYSIWDDHDFGKNDTSGGPDRFKPKWKLPAWKVFKENWVNPSYGGGPEQPGCWYRFSIGDVEFFMTDGRYYRSFKNGTMLGPVQKKWLMDSLSESTATFKVIASGTLWTKHADKGGADSWWGVKEEREEILSLIDREKIPGVILLSADRHRNDIYRLERPNGYDLYEFETSKLTNDHTHPTREKALFSYNKGNFYGLLRFDLTQDDPTVTFDCISIDGELIHRFPLKRSQLEAK